ncbi:MAG: hypothetical protein EBU08_04185 [Micrococcales bacterium]|nr:hypothetical protein [Micrococcales bacterium]
MKIAWHNDNMFDYSSILMKIERLEHDIHQALLIKRHADASRLVEELIKQSIVLKQWIDYQ